MRHFVEQLASGVQFINVAEPIDEGGVRHGVRVPAFDEYVV